MRNAKKLLVVLMMVVMVASLFVGCSTEASGEEAAEGSSESTEAPKEKTVKIGVSIANYDDTFLMYMKDGMEAYAKTLGDKVDITYVDAKEDAAKQLGQVENFITQEMDAIVVIPVNTQATQPITSACTDTDTPLVYVNRLPANLPDEVTFVGSESITAGIKQMEYLAEQLDGKGNVVVMMGKLDNEASIMRTEGVHQIADKHDGIDVTKEQTAEWSRAKGMTLMENWLSSGDDIAAVAANNDDMALGAIEALKAAGKEADIIVAGVDATPDALQSIKAGELDATVFQDANGQGEGSISAAYKKAMGEEVDKEVWIPFQLVTPDNYEDFMN